MTGVMNTNGSGTLDVTPQTVGLNKARYVSPPVYRTDDVPVVVGYEATNRMASGTPHKAEPRKVARLEEVAAQPSKVEGILEERGKRYGSFLAHARIAQNLKADIDGELQVRLKTLDPDMKQALDVICDKIARIINGDETYVDNWDDIAGYATLVSKRLTDGRK